MPSEDKTLDLITHSDLLKTLKYEPETGEFYWLISPKYNIPSGSRAGGDMKTGYRFIKLNSRFYTSHRLAFFYMTGAWPVGEIDHINGIRNDNRWQNLRVVSVAQNGLNRKKYSTNTSGAKGVSWHARLQKWRVRIQKSGKRIDLGCFDNIADAQKTYENFARTYYGEFAREPGKSVENAWSAKSARPPALR